MTDEEWLKRHTSLWACLKDVHSGRDFLEWLTLLIPRRATIAGRWVRHPLREYRWLQHARWADRVQEGDMVCDCRGMHVRVGEIDGHGGCHTEDGHAVSLYHCCTEIQPDGTCHGSDL